MNDETLNRALTSLGFALAMRGLNDQIVVVGGGSLILHGLVARTTKDIDIVTAIQNGKLVRPNPLPAAFAQAALDVARSEGLLSN